MNSIDARYRDTRDIAELLEIADKATAENLVLLGDGSSWADGFRARYEALIARRASEDAGGVVG